MLDLNSSSPGTGRPEPKVFIVGTLASTEKFVTCCPSASSYVCVEEISNKPAVIAIPCRRWGCRYCGVRKCFQLATRVEAAKPTKFITLTTWTKNYLGPRDAYDRTRRKLGDFAKVIRKRFGQFEYCRVLEQHKNGYPHYHFAARCPYIPQRELSIIWAELTGNIIVDVRAVEKVESTFKYMMKYLCKQTYVPWTSRRVAWSRSFFPPTEKKPDRVNPFIRGTRELAHPNEYLTSNYRDHVVIERRPGVYVVDSCSAPPEKRYQKQPPGSYQLCRKRPPPSNA